jgi:putative ABC transport system permease protein
MKYFPLVWAAIWRKPMRTTLTLLSVTIAFLLFGMTIGLNARARGLLENSREDRIYVNARYGGPMTAGMLEQIKAMPGVKKVGAMGFAGGYYRDPKTPAFAQMIDKGMQEVWTELPLTSAQFDKLWKSRTGVFVSKNMAERLKLKVGDPLPITSPFPPRADGSKAWAFTVTEIFDESPMMNPPPMGFAIGNYTFFDEARVPAMRGNVGGIQILATSPEVAREVATNIDKRYKNSPTPTQSITERDAYESGVQSGVDIISVTQAVAAAGLFMILFLTGNSIAQSVRERVPEFAAMKTIGFSDTGVMALVFGEAVLPCLLGAAIGIGLAAGFTASLPKMLPPNTPLPPLPIFPISVLFLAFAIAAAVAFASAVIPALRIKRLSVAAALSGR